MQPRTARQPRTILQWAFGFTLGATAVCGAAAAPGIPSARVSPSDNVAPLRETPLTEYRAFRRMHATSDRFGHEAWLEAWTELDGSGFRYTVVSERGSEYIRNKVLRGLLRREQELIADGENRRSELTADNYDFEDAAPGDGERYVLIKPKRKGAMLVDGRMVLSPDGRDLLRVEGRLTKNPSFWTTLVNVIRHYARLDGVRVPIATESIAKLRLAGVSRLEVQYEYETINGRPVSVAARQTRQSPIAAVHWPATKSQ